MVSDVTWSNLPSIIWPLDNNHDAMIPIFAQWRQLWIARIGSPYGNDRRHTIRFRSACFMIQEFEADTRIVSALSISSADPGCHDAPGPPLTRPLPWECRSRRIDPARP